MKRIAVALVLACFASLVIAPFALAQRRIIGAESDEEAPTDAGPAPDPKAKKDDKKKDDKKKDDKKPDDKKPDGKDAKKVDDKRDVLEDTPDEKAKKTKEQEAKDAAAKAAEAAAEAEKAKKEVEQAKLLEEKKAADAKKKLENRDQRLAAAKRIRQITRTSSGLGLSFAIEPGEVKAGSVVEIRLEVTQKVDVPDPKYGNLIPVRGATVTATVASGKGKQKYVVHALETPGRYGFHATPGKDGTMQVSINGTTKDGKSFDATFPIHVGVWPPPDFEDEEKNNLATTEASRGGRKVLQ